jgi:hypothetical protein
MLAAALLSNHAQSVVVQTKDGTETTELLSSLQKLSFSENNLLLNYISGSATSFSLADIRKLYFISGSSDVVNAVTDEVSETLHIYPNPANTQIFIQNLPAGNSVASIYRMDGFKILDQQVSPQDNCITVSTLSEGLYLLQVNGMTLKFIKL